MKGGTVWNSLSYEQSGITPKPINKAAANAGIGTGIWIPSTTKKYCPLTIDTYPFFKPLKKTSKILVLNVRKRK